MERSSEIEGRERPTDRETGRRRVRERERERRMSEGYKATKLGQFRLVRDRLRFRLDRRNVHGTRDLSSDQFPLSMMIPTLSRRSTNIYNTFFFTRSFRVYLLSFSALSILLSRDIAITLLSFPYSSIGNLKKSFVSIFESEKMRDRERSAGEEKRFQRDSSRCRLTDRLLDPRSFLPRSHEFARLFLPSLPIFFFQWFLSRS